MILRQIFLGLDVGVKKESSSLLVKCFLCSGTEFLMGCRKCIYFVTRQQTKTDLLKPFTEKAGPPAVSSDGVAGTK